MLRKFGNSFFRIQHAQIRLDDISEHFYQKMHSHVAFLCNFLQSRLNNDKTRAVCRSTYILDNDKRLAVCHSAYILNNNKTLAVCCSAYISENKQTTGSML